MQTEEINGFQVGDLIMEAEPYPSCLESTWLVIKISCGEAKVFNVQTLISVWCGNQPRFYQNVFREGQKLTTSFPTLKQVQLNP